MSVVSKAKEGKKALAAFAVTFAGLEGFAVTLDAQFGHQPWIHAVAVGIAAVSGAATWFVRNQTTFDQILSAFDSDTEMAVAVADKVTENPDIAARVIRQSASDPDVVERLLNPN